ncbi:hypothetical protein [Microbacterium hibisci]|uniref:hypothetical protein n=1 Tax=Microbacterium hibisci TaxID=2036000 RepID=UPI001941FEA1|nr:hypothetical protein [Microbacterium hibisci]
METQTRTSGAIAATLGPGSVLVGSPSVPARLRHHRAEERAFMSGWWEELVHAVTGRVRRHDDLPDLRRLESRSVALERTHYLVNDRERQGRERRPYVLRCEPDSSRGSVNIAVVSNGRGVGYLPADVAAEIRPFLDRIGGAAIVNGAGVKTGSIRLWVDLPTRSALHGFVSAEAAHMTDAGERRETARGSQSDRQRFARFSRAEQ